MTYANGHYYKTKYYGVDIPDEDLERLLARASEKIDHATFNRSRDFDILSEYEQEMIKKAACAEAEAIFEYGDNDDLVGGLASYAIGDVSVSLGQTGIGSSYTHGLVSLKAFKYLANTRLTSLII